MTTVYYNEIQIVNCTTREWDQEELYDPSGTDQIGTRFKLRFAGYIHVQSVGNTTDHKAPTFISKIGTVPVNIGEAYRVASQRLSEPRRGFRLAVGETRDGGTVTGGGTTLLQIVNSSGHADRDIDNGPKPRGMHIVKVVNNQVLQVEWAIEFTKLVCETPSNTSGVLNNRWMIAEEMDGNWFTTRTIRGHARLNGLRPAHFYRSVVVPGLEIGFRRDRVEYAVSENGLDVEYSISDRQVHDAAPAPATKISGGFTTSTNDGLTFVSSCRCRLDGPPHVDKRVLITRALQVVEQRLQYLTKQSQGKCFPVQASITDVIGEENGVEVSVTIQENPGNTGDFLTRLKDEILGQPISIPSIGYNHQLSQQPGLYGYVPYGGNVERSPAYLFLLHCYLQSPCNDQHTIFQQQQTESPPSGQAQQQPTVTQVAPGTIDTRPNQNWNTLHINKPYTFSRAETKYCVKPIRAHLPIAKTVSQSSSPNDDESVVIDLAPGLCTREITVDAERINERPQIPEPVDQYTDGSLRGKLLDHWVEILPSSLSPDGTTRIFRARGYYKWAMNRRPRAGELLKVGVLPFTSFTQDDNKISTSALYSQVLGP